MDEVLVVALVNAVHGADVDAGGVLDADAGLSDHVRHGGVSRSSPGFDAGLLHLDVAVHARLTAEAHGGLERGAAALTGEVELLVAAHLGEALATVQHHRGAGRALALAAAARRP